MRPILCLVFSLCLSATAVAADWKASAVFDLTTEVVAPNPGAWTATMGTLPGANTIMLGGGFNGIHRRTLVSPERDAADTIHRSYHTPGHGRTAGSAYRPSGPRLPGDAAHHPRPADLAPRSYPSRGRTGHGLTGHQARTRLARAVPSCVLGVAAQPRMPWTT
jgi:hypothetical protein